jgi:4-diphosphocytidyl-2-C-methyl-D-erythritol kinase
MTLHTWIAETAPAKINLYLHVTGRRPDGYHTLDSLVVFAEAGDRVSARATPGKALSLEAAGPFAPELRGACDNLVLRAARSLAEAAGRAPEARLRLEKNLPVASGIGGGSSDAAATLLALNRLWGLVWPRERLAELGLALGADVPACLARRPVFVGGIGEQVCAAPALPPLWAVLANPLRPLETPAVFAAREGAFSEDACWGWDIDDAAELLRLLASRRNDLQPAAIALEPAVAKVLAALEALPGALLTRMSGSGATCFALFDSAEQAKPAARALAAERPDWWVVATRLLTETA